MKKANISILGWIGLIFSTQIMASVDVDYVVCKNPNPQPGLGEVSRVTLSGWIGGRPSDYRLKIEIPLSGLPGSQTYEFTIADPVHGIHGSVGILESAPDRGIILATRVDPDFGVIAFYYEVSTGKSHILIKLFHDSSPVFGNRTDQTLELKDFSCSLEASMPLVPPGT